jgi:hypothetical protein
MSKFLEIDTRYDEVLRSQNEEGAYPPYLVDVD